MHVDSNKINWLRIEKGLSITELHNKSKVSIPTISRLLRGKTSVRLDNIGKIAKALNVNVKELFIDDEKEG